MQFDDIKQRLLANKKTTVLGVVVTTLGGIGSTLQMSGIEPWGAVVVAVAGLIASVGLFWAKD
jgi:multisubunit Na+/H+ antiporter MnhG subunit